MAVKKYAFISYSSKDSAFVNTFAKVLRDMGVSYWKAPDMIPAGSNYAREIPKAISECEVFLLLLSASSQESIWVEKELDSAVRNRKVIIPIQIDSTPMSEMFLFYLNNVQMISYSDNPENAVVDLKEKLEFLISGQQKSMLKQKQTVSGRKITAGEAKRRNALSINKIPTECRYCKGDLTQIEVGTYRCNQCGKDNYDDFQTVRNYLEKNGATAAVIIERETGVSRRVINHFFEQEYLEIPKLSSVRLSCSQCGAPIRTGVLCDLCKSGQRKGFASSSRQTSRGTWHTKW
ncbi:MAG: TIR domain-containing protein [Lachnospiraceae bacterium]|jgi:Zn finger protein HypA/HybF involved in hydrogenase expression|nr:TIR domain-containing protein [Lachnospiraceae bacterium]